MSFSVSGDRFARRPPRYDYNRWKSLITEMEDEIEQLKTDMHSQRKQCHATQNALKLAEIQKTITIIALRADIRKLKKKPIKYSMNK